MAKRAALSDIENNDVMDIDDDEELAADVVSQVNGTAAPKKASDQYQKVRISRTFWVVFVCANLGGVI